MPWSHTIIVQGPTQAKQSRPATRVQAYTLFIIIIIFYYYYNDFAAG